jgi:lysophospholipase L1-like esterase
LTLSCPASVAAQSVDGAAVAVSFAAPVPSGGTVPVTTTCTPASGTAFPVGTTTSTCTARDAAATPQTATCAVQVTVTKVPQLAVSRILAFGDSITSGTPSTCRPTLAALLSWERQLASLPRQLDQPGSYPSTLRTTLSARYSAQTIQVDNAGWPGETTEGGVDRIRLELAASRPQVLLLQEGANDLNQGEPDFSIVANLRDIAKFGREAGAQVFIGTLLPQRAENVGMCASRGGGATRIVSTNNAIRNMAASEGAVLVDLYGAFSGVPGDLIGVDGLHPSPAGYEKIASSFFDALKQRFEN